MNRHSKKSDGLHPRHSNIYAGNGKPFSFLSPRAQWVTNIILKNLWPWKLSIIQLFLKDLTLCNSLQQVSATEDYPEESNNLFSAVFYHQFHQKILSEKVGGVEAIR